MGYTHYLYRAVELEPAAFDRFAADAKRLIGALDVELRAERATGLAGWNGHGPMAVTEDVVSFNGAAPEDYESCVIERVLTIGRPESRDEAGRGFSFTKTQYRPYDRAVTAIYAIAVDVFGADAVADSDGGPEAIEAGRETAERILGRQLRGGTAR